jgi:hypothetical protein
VVYSNRAISTQSSRLTMGSKGRSASLRAPEPGRYNQIEDEQYGNIHSYNYHFSHLVFINKRRTKP